MSIYEDIKKALQELVAPDLKALRETVESNQRESNLRFESLEKEMGLRFDGINGRFDDLLQRLALDRRLAAVEKELDERRTASS